MKRLFRVKLTVKAEKIGTRKEWADVLAPDDVEARKLAVEKFPDEKVLYCEIVCLAPQVIIG